MAQLDGKVAIVTGAASGIGRATTEAMLDNGAAVVAVDVDQQRLESLKEPGRELLWTVCADARDATALAHVVDDTERRFGSLDVLSTCAAMAIERPFSAMTRDDWQETMTLNAYAVALACQAVIPGMRRAGGGSIITWGSIASVVAEAGFAAYCASKGAVLMLTKTIALEHARDGIRANCLCPGMVDTPMAAHHIPEDPQERQQFLDEMTEWQPLGMGQPAQVADIAVFLASDGSRFMTGATVMADGGFTAM